MIWSVLVARDYRLMRRVHNWRPPRWVRLWMLGATRGGDGWLWLLTGVVILLFGGQHRFAALAAAATAGTAGVALYWALKRLTDRRRPCELEPHCWSRVTPPDPFSFPSGHSLTAFAVATPLGLFHPGLLIGLLFCAASVAASRIVLGMHFLSDVLAGSVLGVSLGYAAFVMFR